MVEITSGKDCVTVKTADGDIYSADIVIGADGVHSFTRNAMWNLMRSTEPGLVQKESKGGRNFNSFILFFILSG